MTTVRKRNAFTPGQIETFLAIADTVVPSLTDDQVAEFKSLLSNDIVVNSEDEWAPLLHFAKTSASEIPEFLQGVKSMEKNLNMAQFKAIAGLMDLLRSRAGSLMLCRAWTPFHQQSLAGRTAIIHMWRTSNLSLYAKLYKGTVGLVRYCYSQTSMIYKGLGIPSVDPEINSERYHSKKDSFHQYIFEDLTSPDANLETDVVIVGTGAGGGVVAKNIAEWSQREGKGLNVLVLEQGDYIPHDELKLTEAESIQRMSEKGVMTANKEGNLGIGYGRTFGGGTAINWSVSLRTPGLVRREWADEAGIEWYTSKEFQSSLVRVEERMGVSNKNFDHNNVNRLMLDACDKLGYNIEETPVNSGGHKHTCSYCGHGCRYGEKMGTMNSWLVDASTAGCRFAEKVSVRKVLFEDRGKGKKKVIGVECFVGNEHGEEERKKVTIKCKKVVVSGGSLHSPALLLRSNITNPQIGRHLRLHPVTFLYGFFPATHPSAPINPHVGPVISTVITETANLGSSPYTYYGSRIECGYVFPIVGLPQLPWLGGLEFKRYLARHRNMMALFSIARDGRRKAPTEEDPNPTDPVPGVITLDKFSGDPIFSYVATKEDRDSIVEGLVIAAEVLRTAGATEILPGVRSLPPYVLQQEEGSEDKGICDPGFRAWIAELRKFGGQEEQLSMSSAHQMGSNRMGPVPWEQADSEGKGWIGGGVNGKKLWDKGGVVDPEGRVYGVEGLYVSDGSVLPGATGVNPMLTIMAVADLLSRRMVARWGNEGQAAGEKSY